MTISAHNYLRTGDSPIEAKNIRECEEALEKFDEVIGKYPWSSSGRGLFSGNKQYRSSFLRRCQGAINHQGSVMIEKKYDVTKDFAMLFFINHQQYVEYKGLSLFANNKRAYNGNILLPQNDIQSILCQYISLDILETTRKNISEFISNFIAPHYIGPVGIDMLIYSDKIGEKTQNFRLNPCVEINLRYTMGFVALNLMNKHLPPNFRGAFKISSENFISPIYLSLNPDSSQFRFAVIENN